MYKKMKGKEPMDYEAIVIGVSAGGLGALTKVLPALNEKMKLPVLIVQHLRVGSDDFMAKHLSKICHRIVKEAEDKEPVEPGTVYFAPPNYHLLVEPDKTISLSTEGRVNYSRPSIDVLFMSAADVFYNKLICIILTGANSDGTNGAIRIKKRGGLVIVQDPKTAEADAMPLSAIENSDVDHIIPLKKLGEFINSIAEG
jgi:two-component system chemotaxis response regulator CheB